MMGYKILDKNFSCRGLQYHVGETAVIEGEPVLCERGLHFCPRALDCLTYYKLNTENRYAEVRAVGVINPECSLDKITSDKYATNALKIVREIPYQEFRKMCTGVITIRSPGYSGPRSESTYLEGERHGRSTEWYYTGAKSVECYYQHDLIHGERTHWIMDGVKIKMETFVKGVRHGPTTVWDNAGNKITEGQYRNNKQDGVWTYYKSGQVVKNMWDDGVHIGEYPPKSWYTNAAIAIAGAVFAAVISLYLK